MSIGQLVPNINVLQRTRVIRFHPTPEADDRHRLGTGILIDYNEQQFLVTSKHLCQSLDDSERLCEPIQLDMHAEGRWRTYPVQDYGWADDDLAVIKLGLFAQLFPISLGFGQVTLGQEVFILGFPNRHAQVGPPPSYDTVPLVGRGTLSSLGGAEHFLVQCNAFHGFSGGPVVSMSEGDMPLVIGVIS